MEREKQKANKLIFWRSGWMCLALHKSMYFSFLPFKLLRWIGFVSWFWMLPWITVNHKCLTRFSFLLPILILRCCQLQGPRHWVGVGSGLLTVFILTLSFLVTLLQYLLLGVSENKIKYSNHKLNPFLFMPPAVREKFNKSIRHLAKRKKKVCLTFRQEAKVL